MKKSSIPAFHVYLKITDQKKKKQKEEQLQTNTQ
jgi:hypothetical protein